MKKTLANQTECHLNNSPTHLVAHLQTAQADTQTKFAKEPPSQRTTDRPTRQTEKGAADNIVLAIGEVNGFVSTEVQNSTFVLRISVSAKNLAHRQYAARYLPF